MADLDLRLVRYFTAVAEHRHFGRAAESLHITQPSLSRQIAGLEQQVGARLLDRTPRGTRLTEAGEAFLPRARALLRSAEQAAAEARAAAEPSRFTVGFTSGLFVTAAVRELRRRHPEADVRSMHLRWDEARTALLERRVDAAVTRLPFATDQLDVTVLYDEPRAVVVPVDHRLAGKESVTIDDIADEPMPRIIGADPAWAAFWRIEPRPDGRPVPDGPEIRDLEDKFEVVAAGEALVITADPTGARLRPDLTSVPLHGVEPSQVALATRAGDRSRLVSAFRRVARTHLTRPSERA
ncbi:LysR substrate-binding domain-containing protein [Streptomyces sp. NPDC047081]|uniref:LysR substrate-binding domain-containing protein n=1 Tax=Streptomyces sp. NPDC047081 TaxID=3154706 RepID=UPI0033C39361